MSPWNLWLLLLLLIYIRHWLIFGLPYFYCTGKFFASSYKQIKLRNTRVDCFPCKVLWCTELFVFSRLKVKKIHIKICESYTLPHVAVIFCFCTCLINTWKTKTSSKKAYNLRFINPSCAPWGCNRLLGKIVNINIESIIVIF